MGSPNYKTGKYSKVLPVRLAARYEEARVNPGLLSLRDDLGACESRLAELFQRLDTGESGQVWRDLRQALRAFELASTRGDTAEMRAQLDVLRTLITQGTGDYAAWQDVRDMWIARCKMTETEQRTLLVQQQMITVTQLGAYLGIITHAIQQRVTAHADTATARRILGEISQDLARFSVLEDGRGSQPSTFH
jgi:hypothetical protein